MVQMRGGGVVPPGSRTNSFWASTRVPRVLWLLDPTSSWRTDAPTYYHKFNEQVRVLNSYRGHLCLRPRATACRALPRLAAPCRALPRLGVASTFASWFSLW